MEEKQTKRKPKRILKDISFENDAAHLALVHRDQGGPASGADYKLVVKSTEQYSDEFLEKAASIALNLELTEYVTKFYAEMEDSTTLAKALGCSEEETVEDKIKSIETLKQLYEAENMSDVLSNLSEDDYLQMLQDQQIIEKVFKKIDAEKNKPAKSKVKTKVIEQDDPTDSVEKSTEDVTSVASEVINEDKPSVVTKHKEKKSMAKETVQVIDAEIEVVNKAQYDEIQKAMQLQTEQLNKALEQVELFKKEKQEAIAKNRKEQLVKACGEKAEIIFKACGDATDEDFAAVVKALADMQSVIEKSDLFKETGASVEVEADVSNDIVANIIKSKYNNK